MSAGCRRCATYGSAEQKLARAKRIVEQENRLSKLEDAIRDHRDARGDDRCWLDDIELYKALGEPVPEDMELALPNRDAFLTRCGKYFEHRQAPGCKPWKTVEEGAVIIGRLAKALEDALEYLPYPYGPDVDRLVKEAKAFINEK
jgi:hypothetical protein